MARKNLLIVWVITSPFVAVAQLAGDEIRAVGPDAVMGELRGSFDAPSSQPLSYGVAGAYVGYSCGVTTCNIGTQPLETIDGVPNHPIAQQALYRYMLVNGSGQFEMIGQKWPFHENCGLQGTVCSECTPYCGGCCNHIGVGCSSPDTADINGQRLACGPKSQVNAATGQIVYPYSSAPQEDVTTGRLRVLTADVNPTLNPGAAYYVEGQLVALDDAAAGNKNNNCSYRRCVFGGGPNFTMFWASTVAGQTVRQTQTIRAWGNHEHTVAFTDVDVPNDGRFTLGYNVSDLSGTGDGPWHYEYALNNMNSDRSGSSFSVPLPPGVNISNPQFHDVEYYKDGFNIGTAYDGTDWQVVQTPGTSLAWNVNPAVPFENSNTLRWGTLYNFRFDADSPPVAGQITLGLFKPGSPASVTMAALIPSAVPCACPGDLNSSSTVDGDDIAPFTSMYTVQIPISNCADVAAPNSGPLDDADLSGFVELLINGPGGCK